MRPVAIIQHQDFVPPGHIATALQGAGVEHFVFDATHDTTWPSADELGGLVILGGTMSVDEVETYPFLRRSRELLNAALDQELPTLGVCLGAQMMARVLGAEAPRAPAGNAMFSPLEFTEAGALDPLLAPFRGVEVLQFHQDTFHLPDGATLLATSAATGLHQAFRYGSRAYALQFHPEVDAAIVRGWCQRIDPDVLAGWWRCSDAGRSLEDAGKLQTQTDAGSEFLARFIDLAEVRPGARIGDARVDAVAASVSSG